MKVTFEETNSFQGHLEHEEGLLQHLLAFLRDDLRRGERQHRDQEQTDDGLLTKRGQRLHGGRGHRHYSDGWKTFPLD